MRYFKNTLRIAPLTLILGLAFVATPALADHHGKHDRSAKRTQEQKKEWRAKRSERRIRFLKEKVGLSDTTIEKMKAIHKSKAAERKASKQRMKEARKTLKGLIANNSKDDAAYTAALDEFKAARKQLHELRIGTMEEVNALLTPAQQAKMVLSHDSKRHGKRGGHHRKHRSHRPRG